jgi:hypothetical protein
VEIGMRRQTCWVAALAAAAWMAMPAAAAAQCQVPTGVAEHLTYRFQFQALEMTWQAPAEVQDITGWQVEVGAVSGGSGIRVVQVPGALRTFTTMFDINASQAFARVRALNACGLGPPSAEVFIVIGGAPPVLINEFGPFIELVNVSNAPVDLGGWRLHTSVPPFNSPVLQKTFPFGAVVDPGCHYLLVRPGQVPPVPADDTIDVTDPDGLALARPDGQVVDEVGRIPPEGAVATPFFEGELDRIPTRRTAVPLGPSLSYTRQNALDTGGNERDFILSAPPSPDSRATCGAPPNAPRSLTALVRGTDVVLTWVASTRGPITTYVVEVGSGPGRSDVVVAAIGPTRSINADRVPPGTYFVRVRSAGAFGLGPPTSEIVIRMCAAGLCPGNPAAPVALFARVDGARVTLDWTPGTGGDAVSFYRLEVGSAAGASDLLVFDGAGLATSVTADDVPPGIYFVRVRAVGTAEMGLPSPEIIVVVPPAM